MAENTSNICPNCQHENHSDFKFCAQCGQKNRPLRITFFEFIRDFIDVIFNLDNRFWKTIKSLFIPGRLTKIFFEGKRKAFYHPIRLYVVAVLFLFTILSFLDIDRSLNITDMNLSENYEQAQVIKNQSDIIKGTLDSLKMVYNDPQSLKILDTVSSSIFLVNKKDSIYINGKIENDTTSFKLLFNQIKLTSEELFINDIDQVVKQKQVKSLVERLALKQFLKGIRDVDSFNAYLFANLTWLFLAIIPVFSLVLKLFYIRRKRFYMEHFVFLLHLNTALIFATALLIAIFSRNENPSTILITSALLFTIFPFLAFKHYYSQGIIKTLVKYIGIGVFFALAFIVTFAVFLLVSAALF